MNDSEAELTPPSAARQLHILLVDDDPSYQKLVSRALHRVGHNVHICENGAEALTYLQSATLDTACVDGFAFSSSLSSVSNPIPCSSSSASASASSSSYLSTSYSCSPSLGAVPLTRADSAPETHTVLTPSCSPGGGRESTAAITRSGSSCSSVLPDCIIVDWEMPVLDGVETVRRIRRSSSTWLQNVPIVGFSASRDPQIEGMFLQAGVTHFLRKPVSPAVIAVIVETSVFSFTGTIARSRSSSNTSTATQDESASRPASGRLSAPLFPPMRDLPFEEPSGAGAAHDEYFI
jgi:CheY-like chemotaxis protein